MAWYEPKHVAVAEFLVTESRALLVTYTNVFSLKKGRHWLEISLTLTDDNKTEVIIHGTATAWSVVLLCHVVCSYIVSFSLRKYAQ